MIEKTALSPAQSMLAQERLSMPDHRDDLGPPKVWATYASGLFAFFEATSSQLVVFVEASGQNDVRPGLWVDSSFRGRGYGKKVVDILRST